VRLRHRMQTTAAIAMLGLASLVSSAWGDDKAPIRIGIPLPQTGPVGNLFAQSKRAIDFAIDEINAKGGIMGRKVETRYVDTEGKPDVARKQVEKLALDGYGLLFGTVTSGEGLAVGPNLKRWNAVLVSSYSKSVKLIGDSCQARFFRTNPSDPSELKLVNAWLATRKEKKWVTIANDYAFGHDATEGFKKAAADRGLEVVKSLFPPFGSDDYAPFIQQIKEAAPDGVFAVLAGRDAINFDQQAKQFGLLGSTLVGGLMLNQDSALAVVGRDAVGVWGNVEYSSAIDTPENSSFVTAWQKAFNHEPTDQEGETYVGITTLLQGIEKAASDDPGAVAKALSGGTFDTLYGKATMRPEDHQMIVPVYFAHVEDVNGIAQNVVTMTLSADQAAPPIDPACKMAPP
jgi:branched-chain amino acid transport system substrate-binding protein